MKGQELTRGGDILKCFSSKRNSSPQLQWSVPPDTKGRFLMHAGAAKHHHQAGGSVSVCVCMSVLPILGFHQLLWFPPKSLPIC